MIPKASAYPWAESVRDCERQLRCEWLRAVFQETVHRVFARRYCLIGLNNWGGGGKIGKFFEIKQPKSTLLADNTQGLITTKQTKPRPVASAASHPITPAYGRKRKLWKKKRETIQVGRDTKQIKRLQFEQHIKIVSLYF